jgi:hypothetical protein
MKVIKTNEEAKTVTVEINGVQRDLQAEFYGRYIDVHGIAVRYPTGSKIWFGSFIYWPETGHTNIVPTPMQSRAGRLSTYVHVVGFYSDFPEKRRSERPSRS